MTTFFELLGLSLIAGLIFTAAVWPLLWVFGVFQTPAWVEAILSRLTGTDSGSIVKPKA
ncbi:MAG: hypothetical protein ABSE45_10125 [Candidatus Acidiferrales bacterium]